MNKNKALFLDRDGTINFDSNYVFNPDVLSLLDGAAKAISIARDSGFKIIIVTNQSCVGRGYATIDQVNATNEKLESLLLEENPGAIIDLTLVAPDHPDKAGPRRKPKPGMIYEAVEKFNLDISQCWIIGDKINDPMTGIEAGIPKSQCLKVFRNRKHDVSPKEEGLDFQILLGLKEAVEHVINNS